MCIYICLIESETQGIDLSWFFPCDIRNILYHDFSISWFCYADISEFCILIDWSGFSITSLVCSGCILIAFLFFSIRCSDHYIRILYECLSKFLFFCAPIWCLSEISILKDDIKSNTLHSDGFETLDEISIDRFWYSEHLEIRFCLKAIESGIIDIDDHYIFRCCKCILIEPIECCDILTIDKEMRKRKAKTLSRKTKHSKNKNKTQRWDNQNMFEIFMNLHIIAIVSDFSLESKNRTRLSGIQKKIKYPKFLIISSMLSSFLRGIMFSLGCSMTLIIFSGIAHAASGWVFGDILAKILGITPAQVLTYTGDGTVANANKLGWIPASNFQKVAPGQSCGAGKCIFWFDASGNVQCR